MTTREPVILITGANGEVGHGLIKHLAHDSNLPAVIAFDLKPLDEALRPLVKQAYQGNILDRDLLQMIHETYEIDTIFHLAALLSSTGERKPFLAHEVNVEGTAYLLEMAVRESQARQQAVKFIYPSSIAVYGLPDVDTKRRAGIISEETHLNPTTMYGCNKLYCEHLGRYYTRHYQQLSDDAVFSVDFRCLRFPGLISAFTVPSGGTSDYAPEMVHAAARGEAYVAFVREDTMIPFMAMPDGVNALIQLSQAPREALRRQIYNVTSFSATAAEIAVLVQNEFPQAQIGYQPHAGRQAIVDSWPTAVNDDAARRDWHWQPAYDMQRTFYDYLFPNIRSYYQVVELP